MLAHTMPPTVLYSHFQKEFAHSFFYPLISYLHIVYAKRNKNAIYISLIYKKGVIISSCISFLLKDIILIPNFFQIFKSCVNFNRALLPNKGNQGIDETERCNK